MMDPRGSSVPSQSWCGRWRSRFPWSACSIARRAPPPTTRRSWRRPARASRPSKTVAAASRARRACPSAGISSPSSPAAAVDRALVEAGPLAELYLLKTSLDLRRHRWDAAGDDLAALRRFAGNAQIVALTATLAFQRGEYQAARAGYLSAIEKDPTWDNLARLAYWESKFGDPDVADRLYERAQQRVGATDKRSWAWVALERGLGAFNRGRYGDAGAHYARAGQAYSGFWLVDEHVAELLGAERRFDRAVALYESVVARVPRPELQQALGDLLRSMGREAQARPWHDRALAGYLESVERGEVHYYHHLAGFYADVRQDGAEAVKWARRDAALRPSFFTLDALAWALYRDGQFTLALDTARQALASGANDPHLAFHGAMIHLAAGQTAEGKRLLEKVARLNPGYENFHVHR
jgi:tetratricopeptide (TPR) repeat protein